MELEYELVQSEAIQLVGFSRKTGFENDQYTQDIEQLWRQYFESSALLGLEDLEDQKIYVAYSNYSEDGKQFTITIGNRVSSLGEIPVGVSTIKIPAENYAQFQVQGDLEDKIPLTWQSIETLDLERSYSTDLEVYDYPDDTTAKIWVAVD